MGKKSLPKVSIVIPVYNGSKYVREAIDSALAQTYANIEIIVVNDGSNDEEKTNEILLSYGDKIKYLKKENGGVSTALNLAIKNSSGEYISWLSHDDVYYPDKIEKQINYILSNGYRDKYIILYGDYDLIDSKSRLISECTKDHQMLIEKPEYALLRGSINGITLLIQKKAFDEFGLFDESLRCTQDYEMWKRMSKKYTFVHMSGIIAKSRQHGEQVSVKNPRVITEGNDFWTNLVSSTPKKVMERLEGSEYAFYEEMAKFLSDSPYEETARFCEEKSNAIAKKILSKVEETKVSVIIPFYNRVDLVIESLKSVMIQSHKNLEIIVVNDGSEDDITKLNKVITTDERIKFINVNPNKGASNARNVGIEKATGDYVAFLDSDDLFKANKLEEQLKKMLLYNAEVSHTSYLRKGFKDEVVMHSGTLTGKAAIQLIYSCPIATPTVMIKGSVLKDKEYRFDTNHTIGEDTCLWLKLLRHRNLLGIDEDLTIVNVLESSSAYSDEKQVLGLKTILTFVLNDTEYNQYDYEIALLCNAYINGVNALGNKGINVTPLTCPNCQSIMNSRSWKITKPLRDLKKVTKSLKQYGFVVTINKIWNKLIKR